MNTLLKSAFLLVGIACLGCTENANGGPAARRDIAYATIPGVDTNLLSLDVYASNPPPGRPAPVVVWVHGGGWAVGDKANQMQIKPVLFTSAGYCFVSINYRLSPRPATDAPDRVMYPVHEQDVASAIAWVHAHIAEYGGDPERIALMGHSAGAHLVSIVSTDEAFLGIHKLPLGVIKGTISLDTEGYDIPAHMAQQDMTGIYENAFGTDPTLWRQASPVYHIASGKGIPPFLLVTRGMFPRRKMSEDFAAGLRGAGVRATVVDATGYSHNEVNSRIGAPGETVVTPPVMQFLAACFGTKTEGATGWKYSQDYFPGTRDALGQWMGGTETMSLLTHKGKLFAGIGYWMDVPYLEAKGDDPWTGAQVLVRDSASSPWRVDVSFGPYCGRTESLASVVFTTDAEARRLDPPVNLLVAGPSDWNPVGERWASAWTRDNTSGKWAKSEISVEPKQAGARSLANHIDTVTGVHHIFAGLGKGAIFRGVYDPAAPGLLRWHPEPELDGKGRVMAMAEANGVLHAACGIKDDSPESGGLFRRIDGPAPKWELVYRWPYRLRARGDESEIMRGFTAIPDPNGGGYEVFLATRSFPGVIERIDPKKNYAVTQELDIRAFFAKAWGVDELAGPCLSAYNRFTPAMDPATGEPIHFIGVWVEHPQRAVSPHNGSYYLIRRKDATYAMGSIHDPAHPLADGKGLHGTRTIEVSPFPEDEGKVFYFGGHDCANRPSHNTAWIYKGRSS